MLELFVFSQIIVGNMFVLYGAPVHNTNTVLDFDNEAFTQSKPIMYKFLFVSVNEVH